MGRRGRRLLTVTAPRGGEGGHPGGAQQLSVRLLRALALDVHPWDAIPGEPFN
jgi:hypothetical protein